MKKILLIFIILILIHGCSQKQLNENDKTLDSGGTKMEIISNNFKHDQDIPSKFTCQGENIRPHLKWSEFPRGTKSFAISVLDPDAPRGTFVHWLIYNIPASVTELEEGLEIPKGAIEVANDAGKKQFIGPCPPSGKHRYFFKVYALNVDKLSGINSDNFIQKIEENSIESAEIIGLYQKK